MRKIILVGYMAVGKSTIGKIMAQKMNFRHQDLDELIEKEENLTINEIFNQKGEIYFRKVEHLLFKSLVESNESLIISTGGGTPCYANNHLMLNGNGIVSVYLSAPIALLFERLLKGKESRPLVANQSEEEIKEFIAKNLFERSYYYNQSKYKVEVIGKMPNEIADEIIALLN